MPVRIGNATYADGEVIGVEAVGFVDLVARDTRTEMAYPRLRILVVTASTGTVRVEEVAGTGGDLAEDLRALDAVLSGEGLTGFVRRDSTGILGRLPLTGLASAAEWLVGGHDGIVAARGTWVKPGAAIRVTGDAARFEAGLPGGEVRGGGDGEVLVGNEASFSAGWIGG